MSTALPAPRRSPLLGRNAAIVGSVVAVHGVALWALNAGLLRPAVEMIVPVQILAELVAPPPPPAPPPVAPKVIVPPPPAPKPVERQRVPPPPRPVPVHKPAPAPQPLVVQQAEPAAPAVAMAPPAPIPAPAPPAPAPAPPAPPAPPAAAVVVPPSSRAAHLNNPAPPYPAMSRRLGESGRVVLRVLIGPDGRAQEVRVQRSSGFERLDELALETARDRWRYVPGTRGGVPEAMWFNVPINFVLE